MPVRGPRLTFGAILLAIVVLSLVPVLAFSLFLLVRHGESVQAQSERSLILNARAIASGIDAQFSAAELALTVLRASPALANDDLGAIETHLRLTSAQTGRNFALVDESGQQLVNTFLPPGRPPARNDAELWRPVFEQRRTHVTNVFAGATTGRLLVGIGIPIERQGRVRWALVTGLFADDFAREFRVSGVPPDWIVSIVDRNGTHLLRSHNNDQFAGKPLVPELVSALKRGESGVLKTTSLEGIPLISTVQPAAKSGWAAAVGLPTAALEAPIRETMIGMAMAAGFVGLAAFVLAMFAARKLDRAMRALTVAAGNLGRGAVVRDTRSGVAEVDLVANAMASASQELRTLTGGLEAQVAERTAALSRANEELKGEIKRRRDSEAQVLQMQKIEAIGQLTGGIAHDFNNMLSVVLGSLRLMQRRLAQGETDVRRYADSAIEGAERAARLTARLLAFARKQSLAPEPIDVNKLLAGMGDILRRTIPENVEIETVLAGGVWQVHVDRQALESAIINLAVNARDAMPNGGKITLDTANAFLDDKYTSAHADVKPGQYVMIAVTDNGIGMPPAVLAHAFDPFFTTKPAGSGTGLGLSQVHGFIKQSGGHVAIYSEIGRGTTVKLYLPRHFGEARTGMRQTQASQGAPRARNGETVLLVEDEPEVRKLTAEMLEELGYVVLPAHSGAEALSLLDRHPQTGLLLTDVVMPGMNGRDLATAALQKRPDLAVLFTTGYTRNAIVHHGVLDADVQVLVKPYTLEELAQTVSAVLYGDSPRKLV